VNALFDKMMEGLKPFNDSETAPICVGTLRDLCDKIDRQARAIEVMREGIRFYKRGTHLMQESEAHPGNVCPPIGFHAEQALAAADRILEGEE
jgi:hypothetical protein